MRVGGHFRNDERYRIRSAILAEIVERKPGALTGMHRRAALQVRQRKGGPTITAIGGAQQRKQGRVLRDGHQLPGAKGPTLGGEVKREDANLSNKWVHILMPSGWRRINAEKRNDKVNAQLGLEVGVGLTSASGSAGVRTH